VPGVGAQIRAVGSRAGFRDLLPSAPEAVTMRGRRLGGGPIRQRAPRRGREPHLGDQTTEGLTEAKSPRLWNSLDVLPLSPILLVNNPGFITMYLIMEIN
jgi:hypothetical protein